MKLKVFQFRCKNSSIAPKVQFIRNVQNHLQVLEESETLKNDRSFLLNDRFQSEQVKTFFHDKSWLVITKDMAEKNSSRDED